MSTHQSIPKPANTTKKSDILPVVAPIQSRPVIAQPKIESTRSNEEQLAQMRAKREAAERLGSTLITPEMVPRTLPPLQPKLTIGQPNDQYEQEADRVARQVVDQINAPPKIQAKEIHLPMSVAARKPSPLDHLPAQRVQRQATGGQMDASPDWESSIQRARGGGQPLDNGIRARMEGAFGADFSRVRVHTDGTSDQLNQSIQAKAFTTGQDVFFRKGAYNPGSRGGQELLAHELTHVVQQKGAEALKGDVSVKSKEVEKGRSDQERDRKIQKSDIRTATTSDIQRAVGLEVEMPMPVSRANSYDPDENKDITKNEKAWQDVLNSNIAPKTKLGEINDVTIETDHTSKLEYRVANVEFVTKAVENQNDEDEEKGKIFSMVDTIQFIYNQMYADGKAATERTSVKQINQDFKVGLPAPLEGSSTKQYSMGNKLKQVAELAYVQFNIGFSPSAILKIYEAQGRKKYIDKKRADRSEIAQKSLKLAEEIIESKKQELKGEIRESNIKAILIMCFSMLLGGKNMTKETLNKNITPYLSKTDIVEFRNQIFNQEEKNLFQKWYSKGMTDTIISKANVGGNEPLMKPFSQGTGNPTNKEFIQAVLNPSTTDDLITKYILTNKQGIKSFLAPDKDVQGGVGAVIETRSYKTINIIEDLYTEWESVYLDAKQKNSEESR